jgi:cell division protein FtsQ
VDGGGRKLLSLKRFGKIGFGAQKSAAGHLRAPERHEVDAGGHMVLPRPLRFALRHLSRTIDTTAPVRAGTGSVLAIGFLALVIGYGVYRGGHTGAVMSSAASSAGLKVDAIKISGQLETAEKDVLAALDLENHGALLGLDLRDARARLAKLPWVEQVSIRKLFPGTLEVSLIEKRPFAVWQRDEQLNVIEGNGQIITKIAGQQRLSARHALLPRIVGRGAEKLAAELFVLVSAHPSIASRVGSYVRVADRRWDILLRNNIVVQLPEHNERLALAAVVKMDHERQLLSRAIEVVDMRLPDRMVLRMDPEAAEKRRISIKDRSKRMFKAEKSI